MVEYLVQDASIELIADAIRSKAGVSGKLSFPDGFASAIAAISTGAQVASGDITSNSQGVTSFTINPGFVVNNLCFFSTKDYGASPPTFGYYVNGSGAAWASSTTQSSIEATATRVTLLSTSDSTTLSLSGCKIWSTNIHWVAFS